jgi:HAD superfamily hydrolase (TIGR01549 family)
MTLRAVLFDVGETLVDETRLWEAWAEWLGIPHLTFMGVLGGLIERDQHHLAVLEHFRPGFDLERERAARREAGRASHLEKSDLYPDAIPSMEALKEAGFLVGVAGNQPLRAEECLRSFGLPADLIVSSERLGVEKPSLEFFRRVADLAGFHPEVCAYVGDRVDNDILPAREAGMVSIFIRRGPWGHLHASRRRPPKPMQSSIRSTSYQRSSSDRAGSLRAVGQRVWVGSSGPPATRRASTNRRSDSRFR